MADALQSIKMETLETIHPFTLAPWETRMQADVEAMANSQAAPGGTMQAAVSSSARNGLVGFGVAIEKQPPRYRKLKLKTSSVTLGARAEQSPYSGELAAITHALDMPPGLKQYRITLLTERAGPTPDRHGQTQWLSLSDQSRRDGSVWMWTSKRNGGTLPLSMSEVDHPPDGNAAMYSYSPKQHILFPGR